MALTLETGLDRRYPADGLDFAHASNADATIDPGLPVRLLRRRRPDVAFRLAQTDVHGNVNASKFSGRPVGYWGLFINITQNAKKVRFGGAFTAGGLEIRAADGRPGDRPRGHELQVPRPRRADHLQRPLRRRVGQTVMYVTERAVFQLTREGGMELLEVAPGVDIERATSPPTWTSVLRMERVREMDAGIFSERWGRLHEEIPQPAISRFRRTAARVTSRLAAACAVSAKPRVALQPVRVGCRQHPGRRSTPVARAACIGQWVGRWARLHHDQIELPVAHAGVIGDRVVDAPGRGHWQSFAARVRDRELNECAPWPGSSSRR